MNRIEINGQNDFQIDITQLSAILDQALTTLGHNGALVEIDFVSTDQIRRLNYEHRRIDKPTDVLSFPQIDLPAAIIKTLGNIVISTEIVTQKDEDLVAVAKHGLLHLLGYDHETAEEKWQKAADKIDCKY